jgi:tyrosine-protein phosphatase YwqE
MFSFFKRHKTTVLDILPTNFTEIHCHLLPGIDDGAKSLEEAAALVNRFEKIGAGTIICTPHVMESVWENTAETITQKLNELEAYLQTQGTQNITLRAAAEYMLDSQFEQLLKSEKLLTLKDPYILVELSYFSAPINLFELLFSIQVAGYIPVLAHPERYNYFHHNMDIYRKLKDAGCLFQLNLLSLSNYYGPKVQATALQLLKQNLIDFAGTDTHGNRHLDALAKITNPKILDLVEPVLHHNSLFR